MNRRSSNNDIVRGCSNQGTEGVADEFMISV